MSAFNFVSRADEAIIEQSILDGLFTEDKFAQRERERQE